MLSKCHFFFLSCVFSCCERVFHQKQSRLLCACLMISTLLPANMVCRHCPNKNHQIEAYRENLATSPGVRKIHFKTKNEMVIRMAPMKKWDDNQNFLFFCWDQQMLRTCDEVRREKFFSGEMHAALRFHGFGVLPYNRLGFRRLYILEYETQLLRILQQSNRYFSTTLLLLFAGLTVNLSVPDSALFAESFLSTLTVAVADAASISFWTLSFCFPLKAFFWFHVNADILSFPES